MPWFNGFIDFSHGQVCHFCSRPLPSGKVLFLHQDRGDPPVPAGPVCGIKHAGKKNSDTPDIASQIIIDGFTQPTLNNPDKTTKIQAIEYLVLRGNRLADARGIGMPKLKLLYLKYLSNKLADDDIRYLINLNEHNKSKLPTLTLDNLKSCYVYHYWIGVALKQANDAGVSFLKDIDKYLLENLFLSNGQILSLNNWFGYLNGIPDLEPAMFVEQIKRSHANRKKDTKSVYDKSC
ncbi:MAG: hypothetical protein V3T17_02785 [Pseudomonadales bacterium]